MANVSVKQKFNNMRILIDIKFYRDLDKSKSLDWCQEKPEQRVMKLVREDM